MHRQHRVKGGDTKYIELLLGACAQPTAEAAAKSLEVYVQESKAAYEEGKRKRKEKKRKREMELEDED